MEVHCGSRSRSLCGGLLRTRTHARRVGLLCFVSPDRKGFRQARRDQAQHAGSIHRRRQITRRLSGPSDEIGGFKRDPSGGRGLRTLVAGRTAGPDHPSIDGVSLNLRTTPLNSPPCYHEHSTMPDPRPQPSPISEAVTNDIRVEVLSRYSAENSRPLEDNWIFQYTVRITNQGAETVQLVSRHWTITDGLGHTEEVTGPGVVGEQPVLAPGESFQSSSWCPLKTPTGRMHGTYQMARADGNQFDIEIAPFALKARYAVN